jgi:hypothetical protein
MVVIQVHTRICYPLSILHVYSYVLKPKNIERSDKERRYDVVIKKAHQNIFWGRGKVVIPATQQFFFYSLLNLFEEDNVAFPSEIIRIFFAT